MPELRHVPSSCTRAMFLSCIGRCLAAQLRHAKWGEIVEGLVDLVAVCISSI